MVVIVVLFVRIEKEKKKLPKCSVGRNESFLFFLSSLSPSLEQKKKMFYMPVNDDYDRLPVTYIPVYSTSINRTSNEHSNSRVNNDLTKVQKELAEIREELNDLRLEKAACPICSPTSSTTRSIQCGDDCSICYPRTRIRQREENYSRASSPVHYCSICQDYVVDQEFPPPSTSRPYTRAIKKKSEIADKDKLSEYLSRQLDLQQLHPRYIPEHRPIWIPTAYKHDYPNRRWATRSSHFSEP